MGICTKIAKRIFQNPTLVYPSKKGGSGYIATSSQHPDYAVIFDVGFDGVPLIITVVFRTYEDYVREGATFIIKG